MNFIKNKDRLSKFKDLTAEEAAEIMDARDIRDFLERRHPISQKPQDCDDHGDEI